MLNASHSGLSRVLVLCTVAVCLTGCPSTLQNLLDSLTGAEADTPAAAETFEPAPRPSINWAEARAKEPLNLKLLESDGPAWTIAFYAMGSKDKAAKEAKKLRKKNWNAHIANLASYGSANNKALWLVYVGPYGLGEEALVRADLKTIQKKIRKKAYAVTLGPHGSRRQFNDPDGKVKHVQPKAAPTSPAQPVAPDSKPMSRCAKIKVCHQTKAGQIPGTMVFKDNNAAAGCLVANGYSSMTDWAIDCL